MGNDKIKAKIKALLEKTTENGASEAEMLSALSKANQLMKDFFISEHDLTDPYILENCVLKETPIIKSQYDLTIIYNALTNLFDCEYYFNKKRIAFFGFESDTEMCVYFYNMISKLALTEKFKYMKSEAYKKDSRFHGRTLCASFVVGFLMGVRENMYNLYKDRESNMPEQYGLMVIDKKKKVSDQFEETRKTLKKSKARNLEVVEAAFKQGETKGKEINITQGITTQKQESKLSLC